MLFSRSAVEYIVISAQQYILSVSAWEHYRREITRPLEPTPAVSPPPLSKRRSRLNGSLGGSRQKHFRITRLKSERQKVMRKKMEYDANQIKLKHIPKLEQIGDVTCCRIYLYCFRALLPQQNQIDQIANNLEQKFIFSKELYDIPQDIEIHASVLIKRLDDYQAQVSILTAQPEETCVYLFGSRTLPSKLEEIFGAIHSIQGQSRETWI